MITYECNIYRSKRNRYIEDMMREAAFVWNHALALQKKYYETYGGYIDTVRMQKHFARRIKPCRLGAQTVQEILQRLDIAYQGFFKGLRKRPPKFKKADRFRSFVFKQDNYSLKFMETGKKSIRGLRTINKIHKTFKFSLTRPVEGDIRTVRVKRIAKERYRLYIVTSAQATAAGKTHDGASAGADFGLKTFLTLCDSDGHITRIKSPEFLRQELGTMRRLQRRYSRSGIRYDKYDGNGNPSRGAKVTWTSNHRKALAARIARQHERIRNRRDDWQWKTAGEICRAYDTICIEDLNIEGMKRLWGRKVSDLAFSDFVRKLEHTAGKYGCEVRRVDRFFASSQICSSCGHRHSELQLKERQWICPICGTVHDRDVNAARNILGEGILPSSGSTRKTKVTFRKARRHAKNAC